MLRFSGENLICCVSKVLFSVTVYEEQKRDVCTIVSLGCLNLSGYTNFSPSFSSRTEL